MKKVLFAAAIMFCLTLLSSQDSNAQALGFYIDNNTGFTLNNIYVAPSESANWGDDILPKDLFDNATQVEVSIPATYGETCLFDIKITDLKAQQ